MERVPDEVWELIQHKLVDLELQLADERFFLELWGECDGYRGCWKDTLEWLDEWPDVMYDKFPSDQLWNGKRRRTASRLLSSFDLALPPSSLLSILEDQADWVSPYSATLLTLDRSSLPDFRTSTLKPVGEQDRVLADVSLDVPNDARPRFTSLIRLLHLEPLEIENRPPPAMSEHGDHNYQKRGWYSPPIPKQNLLKFLTVELKDVSPRWRLYTSSELTW
ncbi:hypothetical protein JCM10213v2_007076 [Rhodosporidiobolus nylandii]